MTDDDVLTLAPRLSSVAVSAKPLPRFLGKPPLTVLAVDPNDQHVIARFDVWL